MGFYGRICPYETPSGQKLGVTNTKAIGAKIRDGILTTPYRRVLKNSRGEIESISTEVTYMDAQEEAQYRIGDILSLKKEGYRYHLTLSMPIVSSTSPLPPLSFPSQAPMTPCASPMRQTC